MIHGDILPGNVLVNNGRLIIIDFEDVLLGFPIQDIAVLLSYRHHRPDVEQLKDRFLKGYSAIKALPDAEDWHYRILIAARELMFINCVLRIYKDPRDYVHEQLNFMRELLGDLVLTQ